MRLMLLITALSIIVTGTANANDNRLFLNADMGISSTYQQHRNAPRIGFTYSFKFGGKKRAQEKYGTLNIQSFAGRKIPVLHFGENGMFASQNIVKLAANGDGSSGVNWKAIALISVGVAAATLMVIVGKKKTVVCADDEILVAGVCFPDLG